MPSRPSLPTLDQVVALPRLLETVVTDEHEDANGHLNVTGYLALHDRAAWPWLAGLGLDPSSSSRPRGIMDLEHHLRYLAEVHVGDRVAVHGQLRERDDRRVHGIWYLVNLTRDQLANTFEFVSVHVDLDRRRATAFDPETAALLDAQVAAAERDWSAPISGSMGL
jgi:acyl-CoA thioester hydrolase